ncbi:hypothetical protein FRB90_003938 [Tulasnella sp. 427]|nr:hypothetical protein FRB90_003938 [Tulasnella sp. 427]
MEQPSPTVPVAAYTDALFVPLSMAVDMTFENVSDALQDSTTISAPESIWVDSQAQIDGVSVKWLDNPAVMVTDVWSSIGFIMSAAASCDTTPGEPSGDRPRDWYVELLIVFTFVIRKVVAKKKRWNTVPNVVHILWSESGNTQPLLQPELDSAASDLSNLSAPATPSRPATRTPRHAIGVTPPSRSPYVKTLIDFRKHQIEEALHRLGPEVKDPVIDAVQALEDHRHLGQCAETFPYLW